MDTKKVFQTFRAPHSALSYVPAGRKDGHFYIVDNTDNMSKREQGQKTEFWDDYGAWKKPSCPKTLFVQDKDRVVTVVLRDNKYCVERTIKSKRVYVPLEPQPEQADVLVMHQTYQTLNASNTCKRRITWFGNTPENFSYLPKDRALIEYIGKFPGAQFHGNVKNAQKNQKYIKTKEKVKAELKSELKHKSAKQVEKKMNSEHDNDFDKQRDDKQLMNFKYNLNKKDKPNSNAADHIIAVEEMVKNNGCVQRVCHVQGLNHPVITLYNNQQICDIKRFCCKEGGEILGLDKTFNLGDFHVTPTVFKDRSVLRRTNMEHPICFGPTFIHTNSSADTYKIFMHHIADRLTDNEIDNLVIGTDEELAFKTAIHRCFSGATHVLCTRHLKNNTLKYMEEHSGCTLKERQNICGLIYDKNGITESMDDDTLNVRVDNVRSLLVKPENQRFLNYFEDRLLPLLKEHIITPFRQGKIESNWTSNNSESANHVLKAAVNWKICDLPKFIESWQEIVDNESKERLRAIRGMGNFKVARPFEHHLVDVSTWSMMTGDQQNNRMKRFRNDKGRFHANEIRSSNGQRTVIKTPSAGKKPNQQKRKRAERSRTPSCKRRVLCD
ncbi:uncharacterized protein LOC132716534 [Ruditapes philippinarum]|uniref:uncharacterized protein LOC132716534 n=1 Tax=Ruditapes philippinarum TaxID=129788 RepID=UPI00295B3439|nr:uncharacterized protein LOC132716534 [Ruditapes philippinarum]